jgi:hypothetical protein
MGGADNPHNIIYKWVGCQEQIVSALVSSSADPLISQAKNKETTDALVQKFLIIIFNAL